MNVPRLLIVKPSSLGDIVHGLLVARMIKLGLPEARLDWICRDNFAPVVQACPVVDRVLLFERHGGCRAFSQLVRTMRRCRYTHVLDFQGLARTGLLTLLARTGTRIGRSDAREGARWCYNNVAPLPRTGQQSHAVHILREFLPMLGLPRQVLPVLEMHIPSLAPEHPANTHPVLIFPESRRAEKNWPAYAQLTRELCREQPDQPVVWAGAVEMASPEPAIPGNFHNLTGRSTLTELLGMVARARLVVGNDSGPLHLAAALGRPTLALFGPTRPELYRPYPGDDQHSRILCAPRGDFGALAVSTVLEHIETSLNSSPADP
jgi:heptosyltransferase I